MTDLNPLGLASVGCTGCSSLLPQSFDDTNQLLGWCGTICFVVLAMCFCWVKLHKRTMSGNRAISFLFFLLLEVSIVSLGTFAVALQGDSFRRSDSDRLLLGTIMVVVPFATMAGLAMSAHGGFRLDWTLLISCGIGILVPLAVFYPCRNSAGPEWKSSFTFLTFGIPLLTALWMLFLVTMHAVYETETGQYEVRGLGQTNRATIALIFVICVEYPFAIAVPIGLLFYPILSYRWVLVIIASLPLAMYLLYRFYRASAMLQAPHLTIIAKY